MKINDHEKSVNKGDGKSIIINIIKQEMLFKNKKNIFFMDIQMLVF